MRLNKFLAQQAQLSRRAADAAIELGRVRVNGEIASLGMVLDLERDEVLLDNKPVQALEPVRLFLAYHKPRGVECTMSTDVQDSLANRLNFPERVYPIGRLDKYSEGLLLLTNDGDFAFQVGHPRFGHEKVYFVTLNEALAHSELEALCQGVLLDDGEKTRPCRIDWVRDTTYRWVLVEGKNRQIRRMAAVMDRSVKKLVRIAFGGLILGDLAPGTWRSLNDLERRNLLPDATV